MKKDLSTVNSLTSFMTNHKEELWKKLSDKNIDVDSLIYFFENGIKKENVSIKIETKNTFIKNIRKLRNNKFELRAFITNTLLKGMGLGV